MAAQVADAQHARRLVGEDQDCGQRWRNLAGRSQVEITQAVDMAAAGHFAVPDAVDHGKLISAPICSKYPGSRPPGWVVDSGQ